MHFEFSLANRKGNNTLKISDSGNAIFSGEITASSIIGSDIVASNITASTIDVDSDISVGNNIYLGNENEEGKRIHFFQSDTSSILTQAYISADKSDLTTLTIMASQIKFNTLNDIIVRRGLGEYKVVTTNMAPYIKIGSTKYYLNWE